MNAMFPYLYNVCPCSRVIPASVSYIFFSTESNFRVGDIAQLAQGLNDNAVIHSLRGPGHGHCAHTAAPLHADGEGPPVPRVVPEGEERLLGERLACVCVCVCLCVCVCVCVLFVYLYVCVCVAAGGGLSEWWVV